MGKILVLIGIALFFGILWSLPLYIGVNLVCLVFGISFHLTLLQSFAVSLLASILRGLIFKGKGD